MAEFTSRFTRQLGVADWNAAIGQLLVRTLLAGVAGLTSRLLLYLL